MKKSKTKLTLLISETNLELGFPHYFERKQNLK